MEEVGVDWKKIFNYQDGGELDWTDMAQDRDRWPALVNTTLYIRVP